VFFEQLLDPDLGCACYVLGDGDEAIVVDPGLDADRILAAVSAQKAVVAAVLETHTHADHVSGRGELCARTGAVARVPDGEGERIAPGDVVTVGDVRVEALAAPGHRPEHLAYLVTDAARSEHPCLLLTGDSILVGDLARPDLAVDPERGGRALHGTVARLLALGDELELWPGHIGGSLCGGARLSRRPSSTLGHERKANPLLAEPDPDVFTAELVRDLPVRPPTVEHVVRRNRTAVPAPPAPTQALDDGGLLDCIGRGALIVDGRPAEAFDAAHIPGSLNLPLIGSGLGTRAAWLAGPQAELVVAGADEPAARELARRLRAVGLSVCGHVTAEALMGSPLTLASAPPIDVRDLPRYLDDLTVVDVRDDAEWRREHLRRAIHAPLSQLRDAARRLPRRPLAVACAGGPRATAAASFLRRAGHDARRVTGGGVPTLRELGVPLIAG
jgi:glyoxylase-like metal-dependent hydrolase (beta-lactamase superfamily II)/rhodanese-related sulfurtransferase